jgi:hypothetical protein
MTLASRVVLCWVKMSLTEFSRNLMIYLKDDSKEMTDDRKKFTDDGDDLSSVI